MPNLALSAKRRAARSCRSHLRTDADCREHRRTRCPHDNDGDSRFAPGFVPGFLVVSRSVYDNVSANVQPGAILPPNCAKTTGGCGAASGAPNDGTYPTVWNNDRYDGSFGITSRIFLDQITPAGGVVSTLEVPNSLQKGFAHDQLVTSFSSKSGSACTCRSTAAI